MNSRRAVILGTLAAAVSPAQDRVGDESFRYRSMTIDALFARVRKARLERAISLAEYTGMVRLLREVEIVIFQEAAEHRFSSETESAVWHRGKLKFPSVLESEMRLLSEGSDPAYPRN
jgi:hypothetical protein